MHLSRTDKQYMYGVGVNTEPMATVNNVFRNTLVDDTEDNDGISQLLCNVETECPSER